MYDTLEQRLARLKRIILLHYIIILYIRYILLHYYIINVTIYSSFIHTVLLYSIE